MIVRWMEKLSNLFHHWSAFCSHSAHYFFLHPPNCKKRYVFEGETKMVLTTSSLVLKKIVADNC